ncbi:hypothetical protein JCM10207_009180 [Rhodosporidiobolus poonsookiae]
MSDAASTLAAIQALLASLPAGTNPYLAIDAFVLSSLDKHLPISFFRQMYFLAGLFAFDLFTVCTILALQLISRQFRLFPIKDGSLRSTSAHTLALLLYGLFYVFAIVAIFRSVDYYRGGIIRDLIGWRVFMWWAPLVAGVLITHALACNYLTHLTSTSQLPPARSTTHFRRLTLHLAAVLLAFFASNAPLAALSVKRYHASLDALGAIDGTLRQAAAAYTGTFDIASLAAAAPLLEAVQSKQEELVDILGIAYPMLGAWAAFTMLCVALVATLHVRSLNRCIAAVATGEKDSEDDTRVAEWKRTKRRLTLAAAAFEVACSGFLALAIYVGCKTEDTMNQLVSIQAVDLALYYLYSLAGASVAVLLLFATIQSVRAHGRKSNAAEAEERASTEGDEGEKKADEAGEV